MKLVSSWPLTSLAARQARRLQDRHADGRAIAEEFGPVAVAVDVVGVGNECAARAGTVAGLQRGAGVARQDAAVGDGAGDGPALDLGIEPDGEGVVGGADRYAVGRGVGGAVPAPTQQGASGAIVVGVRRQEGRGGHSGRFGLHRPAPAAIVLKPCLQQIGKHRVGEGRGGRALIDHPDFKLHRIAWICVPPGDHGLVQLRLGPVLNDGHGGGAGEPRPDR